MAWAKGFQGGFGFRIFRLGTARTRQQAIARVTLRPSENHVMISIRTYYTKP